MNMKYGTLLGVTMPAVVGVLKCAGAYAACDCVPHCAIANICQVSLRAPLRLYQEGGSPAANLYRQRRAPLLPIGCQCLPDNATRTRAGYFLFQAGKEMFRAGYFPFLPGHEKYVLERLHHQFGSPGSDPGLQDRAASEAFLCDSYNLV